MITRKLSLFGMVLATVGMLGGCGSSDDPGTPVKDTPLAGTIATQPFTAKVALADKSSSGTSVTIYDKDATCSTRYSVEGTQILLTVDSWADGYSYQLGGSVDTPLGFSLPKYSVTFVTGGSNNTIVSKGRVEVVKAGGSDTPGTLRLRADGGESGAIEGQVAVTICGG